MSGKEESYSLKEAMKLLMDMEVGHTAVLKKTVGHPKSAYVGAVIAECKCKGEGCEECLEEEEEEEEFDEEYIEE